MNTPLNYVTDPAFVQDWFLLNDTSTWNLYRGFHSKVPERDIIYKQQDSTMDLNHSWELLKRMIDANSGGGGKFTIYVPAFGGNKAATLHYGIGIVNRNPMAGWPHPQVAGMPGMPVGYIPEDRMAQAIAKEREKWDMERRIEDLETAQGANSDIWEVLIDKVRELDPNTTLPNAIAGITQLFQQQRTGVQLQGIPNDQPAPQEGEPQGYVYHKELLFPFLDSIRVHFETDEEFWAFLNAVSAKFQTNPTMFKNLVNG